jgi:hypothetical protein
MKPRVAAAAGAALALAITLPALGHGPDPILSGGLYAQSAVLTYRWSATGTPPAAMKSALNDAADDATASRRSKAPSFDYSASATNLVYYGPDVPCGVNGLACLRRDPPDWFGVWFRPNGTRFDWGTLRWCELSGSPDGCYEAENVMLDELGHVLVLDHHANFSDSSDYGDAVVQTYSRTKPKAGWNAHAYGRCDVATLQQQYDVSSWTSSYSTCLDVPTSMTMKASASSVVSGSMVTFTATLRSDGTGRLSNNPIAGRKVVLQKRSSTGWSDVLTMASAATAGTYTGSTTVRASQDYRALFRATSSEGLQSTWSSAVPITVGSSCTGGLCPNLDPQGPAS